MLPTVRRTSLALANLASQPVRTVISLGGIAFAVLLMLMQLGFLGTVSKTATGIYNHLPFDIAIRSPEYLHLFEAHSIPARLAHPIAQVPGVVDVRLIDLSLGTWQSPSDGSYRAMAMMGIDPDRPALDLQEIKPLLSTLNQPDAVLIDNTTRKEYGPVNGIQFGNQDLGRKADLMGHEVMITGTYELGPGLAASGALIISRTGFAKRIPSDTEQTGLILATVNDRSRVDAIAAEVQAELDRMGRGSEAVVMTREETLNREMHFWVSQTPIGMIFVSGVALAAVVGAMICYMVLATDVMGRLTEYATLKAMGYTNIYLALVVMQQAWLLAIASVVAATPVACLVYGLTSYLAGVSIKMTLPRIVLVALLTMTACSIAALAALRKLARAEPASLF